MTGWTTGTCEANGVSLHFTRTGGEKPPLVLLHGLSLDGRCWAPHARELEVGFDVVMPDARGHGGSSTPAAGYTYDELAADVVGLIQGLALASPILVGHSMGGMTAAVVAARHPTLLRGLVLVDPTFLSPATQREVYAGGALREQHRRLLARSLPELLAELKARHPHRSAELVESIARARLATRPEAYDVLAPPNPDFRQLIGAIRVPTLLVIGGPGGVVSAELASELQRLNGHVQVAQISEAGHGLHLDQPERFIALVKAFLGAGAAGAHFC
jgi:pimeloyl-ACP methyl ester carboxylesterase